MSLIFFLKEKNDCDNLFTLLLSMPKSYLSIVRKQRSTRILPMKQYEAVIETLERLGGIATLGQLNQEVFKITDCQWNTKTPFASIRRIVQERKEIYKIKPGLWALESHRKQLESNGFIVENARNAGSLAMKEFNHSYYQGLLLEIGNSKKYFTYVPEQDKNKRYAGSTLQTMRTLNHIPAFSFQELVDRSATIDVIWFNERKMPSAFFEVEHSTDIQNSLLKFFDLQDFYTKMYIVADSKRQREFEKKLNYAAFKALVDNKRVKFLSYDSLNKLYKLAIENKKIQQIL